MSRGHKLMLSVQIRVESDTRRSRPSGVSATTSGIRVSDDLGECRRTRVDVAFREEQSFGITIQDLGQTTRLRSDHGNARKGCLQAR